MSLDISPIFELFTNGSENSGSEIGIDVYGDVLSGGEGLLLFSSQDLLTVSDPTKMVIDSSPYGEMEVHFYTTARTFCSDHCMEGMYLKYTARQTFFVAPNEDFPSDRSDDIGTATNPYKSLTTAISAATKNAIIYLYPGRYVGVQDYTIPTPLRIEGISGSTFTAIEVVDEPSDVIDDSGALIVETYGNVELVGLTFRNAVGNSHSVHIQLAGGDVTMTNCAFIDNTFDTAIISVISNATLTLRNTTFEGNTASSTIEVSLSKVEIFYSKFISNFGSGFGGVILIAGGQSAQTWVEIYGSTFKGNSADYGGVIAGKAEDNELYPHLYVENSEFNSNNATEYGGSIMLDDVEAEFQDCTFENGFSYEGGAVFAESSGTSITFTGVRFYDNDCSSYDGLSVYINEISQVSFVGCQFKDHYAEGSDDDFVAVIKVEKSSIKMVDNVFEAASVTSFIYGEEADFMIETSFFLDFVGSALYLESDSTLQMENCAVIGNTGGTYAALRLDYVQANISLSNFTECISTEDAGAMQIDYSAVHVDDCIFSGNFADGDGGAIGVADSIISFTRNIFINNSATLNGGGVNFDTCTATMADDVFISNEAEGNGGGIYSSYSTLNITLVSMIRNTAAYGGGIEVNGGYSECIGCFFKDGIASSGGGAASASNSAIFIADGGRAEGCSSQYGGAFNFEAEANPTLKGGLELDGNSASNGGGFFMVRIISPPSPLIQEDVFFRNGRAIIGGVGFIAIATGLVLDGIHAFDQDAEQGGGLAIMEADAVLINSRFTDCSATKGGGSLYIVNGQLSGSSNVFHSGIAHLDPGGGAYIYNSMFEMNSTTFFNCSAFQGYGGGLYSLSSAIKFWDVRIERCSSQLDGGGIYSIEDTFYRLQNCTIQENTAADGGGVYFHLVTDSEISGSSFIQNSASSGGGLFVFAATYINISSTYFLRNDGYCCNVSDEYGGAATLQSVGMAEIHQCIFTQNTGNYGGGLHTDSTPLILRSSVFSSNVAYTGAGWYAGTDPIYARRNLAVSTTVTFKSCIFQSNIAKNGGGGLYWSSLEPDGVDSESNTFLENKATFGSGVAAPVSDLQLNTTSLKHQTSGSTLDTITVLAIDDYGNIVSDQNTGMVTAAALTDGASVSSTTSVYIVEGKAVFSDLTAEFLPNSTMNITFTTSLDGWASVDLMVSFRPCVKGEILTSGSSKCTTCEHGYFSWVPGESSCHICPTGAICYGQNGDEVKALRNYWRFDNTTGVCTTDEYDDCEFHACDHSGACLGDVFLDDSSGGGTDIVCSLGSCTLTTTTSDMDSTVAGYCDTNDDGYFEDCVIFAEGYFFQVNGTVDSLSSNLIIATVEDGHESLTLNNVDLYLIQNEECSDAYVGNACQRCAADYGRGSLGECNKCRNLVLSYAIFFAGMIAVAVIGMILIALQMDKENSENEKLSIMFKIFSSYMQLVAIFSDFDLNWPAIILHLFSQQEAISSAGDKIIQIDCVLNEISNTSGSTAPVFFLKLVFFCLLPILAVLFSFLVWTACYHWKKWQLDSSPFSKTFEEAKQMLNEAEESEYTSIEYKNLLILNDVAKDGMVEEIELEAVLVALGENASRMRVADVKKHCGMEGKEGMVGIEEFQKQYLQAYKGIMNGNAILSIVVLLFMLYTNVSTYVFQLFTCTYLDSSRAFLEQDLMTQCYTTEHTIWSLAVGMPGMIFYVFGIPAFGFFLLHKHRHDLDEDHVKLKYGFLYDGYEKRYYYWEMWVMVRKVFVVFCTVFISRVGPMTEALSGCILVLFANFLHLGCQPYEDDTLDKLETFSLYTTLATLMTGLFFFSGETGTTGTDILSTIIFLFNAAFLLYFLFVAYADFKLKLINEVVIRSAQLQRVNDRIRNKKTKTELKAEKEAFEHGTKIQESLGEICSIEEDITILKGEQKHLERSVAQRKIDIKKAQAQLNVKKREHTVIADHPQSYRSRLTSPTQQEDEEETKSTLHHTPIPLFARKPPAFDSERQIGSKRKEKVEGANEIMHLYNQSKRQHKIEELMKRDLGRVRKMMISTKEREKRMKVANTLLDLNEIHQAKKSKAKDQGQMYYSRGPPPLPDDLLSDAKLEQGNDEPPIG